MSWHRRYIIKSYIRSSLWIVPFGAVLAYVVINQLTYGIGAWLLRAGLLDERTAFLGLSMAGARSMLDTIVTLNLSFLVFTFGSLLVAVQVAGGQYTPRIIATTFLRDNSIRFTVAYFVFTMLFTLRVLSRMGNEMVHQFNTWMAGILGLVSIAIFLHLIDYAARMLRPVSIVQRVGKSGIEVIRSVYPESNAHPRPEASSGRPASPDRAVANAGASGIVLAVDLEGLAAKARHAGGMIEFVPQVGDFVAMGEPLFLLYGGAGALDDRELQEAVALGSERTLEQDPTFAFRILVDIAIKALSPAINDPTTAVLAIDQIHHLLRHVGGRHLDEGTAHDTAGSLRLIYRTPDWEDFVCLAVTEIRQFGGTSIQVARRLRAMLENLIDLLPPERTDLLRDELKLLHRSAGRSFAEPEDQALAQVSDLQGVGGKPPGGQGPGKSVEL